MNGSETEQLLQVIDCSMQRSSDEAAAYIKQNRAALAQSLFRTGRATLVVAGEELQLSLADLEAAAA